MIIFPAIDIKNGNCVRLYKGDMNTAEKVADSFLSAANSFYSCGAEWIHMVDLTERLTPVCREYPDRFKIIPSETNFIYVETPEAEKIFTYLKEAGIIIRKMSGDRLRITAGRNYENDAVASEINAYLKGESHENVVY